MAELSTAQVGQRLTDEQLAEITAAYALCGNDPHWRLIGLLLGHISHQDSVETAARRALELWRWDDGAQMWLLTLRGANPEVRDDALRPLAAALGEEAGQQPTPTDLAGLAGVDEQPLGEDA